MIRNNSVVFKGGKNGILIKLDPNVSFETISAVLAAKLKDGSKFFGDEETAVIFQGRVLSDGEEARLLGIITGLTSLKPVTPAPPAAPPAINLGELTAGEHAALFHYGGLRSGQSARSGGSVVVVGDVNPGAEISAGRNIVVLGALRGKAHAGQSGDEKSFVAALSLNPVQLRICGVITDMPDNAKSRRKTIEPKVAYIKDGQIYVAPLAD